ncbi:MAG: hypothetical protein JWL77_6433 [Chthonomonadaceae bacterium]|nr:hypothetical protein [Chthonomonadaceae bacterium]
MRIAAKRLAYAMESFEELFQGFTRFGREFSAAVSDPGRCRPLSEKEVYRCPRPLLPISTTWT